MSRFEGARRALAATVSVGLVVVGMAAAPATASAKTVLVIGTHPDDEVLVAYGRARAALTAGDTIKVVLVTNGDATGGIATGDRRQADAVSSALAIGLTEQDVIFLGYPDGSLRALHDQTSPTAVITSAAGQTETYGSRGLGGMEYHRRLYGVHGPYNRESVVGDLVALFRNLAPDEIYTHSDWENHDDHQAAALFVTEALATLARQGAGQRTKLYQAVVWMPGSSYPWPQLDAGGWSPLVPFLPWSSPCVAGDCLDRTAMEWSRSVHFLQPPEMLAADPARNLKELALPAGPWFSSFVRRDEVFWLKDFGTNVAAMATVTASSADAGHAAARAVDGVIKGTPLEQTFEWASNGELAGAWIQLDWPAPVRIGQVNLWDRPNTVDNILASHLTFSDGSRIDVGELPPTGRASVVTFAPRTVRWVRFTVDQGEGQAVGLAELEVFGQAASSAANLAPRFVWGPVPATSSIAASSSTLVAALAHDLDGDPVQYAWSSDSGLIQANGATATFTPAPVSTTTWVTVSAQALDGRGGAAVNHTFVQVTPAPTDGIIVERSTLFGGDATSGTAVLASAAGAGGVVVPLASSDAAVTVPASVTIPAGATSATFPIATSVVPASRTVTLTGRFASGARGAAVRLAPRSVSSLALSPASVLGGETAQGTITLPAPAGPSGAVVSLATTSSSVASVPATVVVPAGGTTATFTISTAAVASTAAATVSATYGTTVSATLTVSRLAVAGVALAPSTVGGGASAAGTVTLNGPAPAEGAVVALASGSPSVAAVPATVTVPAGARAFGFTVGTAAVAGAVPVDVTATYGGASASARLGVTTDPPVNANLLSSGEAIGTGWWQSAGALALTAGAALAPDGTQRATRAVSAGGGHAVTEVVPVAPGVTYTFSFFARSLGGAAAAYSVYDATHYVDLVPATSYFPQLSGAAWTRVGVTFTVPAGTTAVGVYPLRDSGGAVDLLLWGAKLEVGRAMTGHGLGGKLAVAPAALVGGDGATGTITLAGPAPAGGTVVTLASSAPAAAAVPASVIVPAGATQATFAVTTAAVSAATAVTISAAHAGGTARATLTVNPAPVLTGVTVSPAIAVGGTAVQGTATFSGPVGRRGAVVTVQATGGALSATITVNVAAGATSASFSTTTPVVSVATPVTVTATLGASRASALLTLVPAPRVQALAVTPGSVTGGAAVTGTVTLAGPAPTGGFPVALASGSGVAAVPASVVVAAGATSATFPVATTPVTASAAVRLTASGGGVTASSTLTVLPVTLSALALSPAAVASGQTSTATVTLSGPAPAGGATVVLWTNHGAVTVPGSVTVAAGATSASFAVSTSAVWGATSVTITGLLGGATATGTLTVNPLGPAAVTCAPASVRGGASATATVTLNGRAPAGGVVVYLWSTSGSAAVPASVTVAAGASSATFPVTTSRVSSTAAATVYALAGGIIATGTLTITP